MNRVFFFLFLRGFVQLFFLANSYKKALSKKWGKPETGEEIPTFTWKTLKLRQQSFFCLQKINIFSKLWQQPFFTQFFSGRLLLKKRNYPFQFESICPNGALNYLWHLKVGDGAGRYCALVVHFAISLLSLWPDSKEISCIVQNLKPKKNKFQILLLQMHAV